MIELTVKEYVEDIDELAFLKFTGPVNETVGLPETPHNAMYWSVYTISDEYYVGLFCRTSRFEQQYIELFSHISTEKVTSKRWWKRCIGLKDRNKVSVYTEEINNVQLVNERVRLLSVKIVDEALIPHDTTNLNDRQKYDSVELSDENIFNSAFAVAHRWNEQVELRLDNISVREKRKMLEDKYLGDYPPKQIKI